MDFASFDTLEEFEFFKDFYRENLELVGEHIFIGAIATEPSSKYDWYWVSSNKRITYDLPWSEDEPNYANDNEWCLLLTQNYDFKFNDVAPDGYKLKFLCQRFESMSQ